MPHNLALALEIGTTVLTVAGMGYFLAAILPERAIRLIECPERLGTNGKVSTLAQLAVHARHDFLLINDSDITVSPRYLERVMACFISEERRVGKESRSR